MRPVMFVVGALLVVLAMAMLGPMLVDLAIGHPDWLVFATSTALTLFFGVILLLTNRVDRLSMNLRQTFLLTGVSWLIVTVFAALPFGFSEGDMSPTDSFFEAMSGLTTTGATVMTGLDDAPPGLLLWRALLQWLGGIGIIGLGIVVLPFLRVGGMQLFRSESSDRSEKVMPRPGDIVIAIGVVYIGMTLSTVIALAAAGMHLFDAVCHALTSVSTAGFSTSDQSIGNWDDSAIQWILIGAMVSGALPFARYVSLVSGDVKPIFKDTQIRALLIFLVGVSLAVGLWLFAASDRSFEGALREAAFNVVSIVTTTGYATTDYTAWGSFAITLFFLLMVVGGCTGSTTGGIKIFRFEILFLALRRQLIRLYSPSRVTPLNYSDRRVSDDVLISVTGYLFIFFIMILILAVVLGALGLDFVTALSAALSAFSNIGPGLGDTIGPAGNFASLPDTAKWILSFCMLFGRLEFFTLLVLLNPAFWRR